MPVHEKLHVAGDLKDLSPEPTSDRAADEPKGLMGAGDVRAGANETYLIEHDATGGTFTLTPEGGAATGTIAFDATAAAVQLALEAHAAIAPGDVLVREAANGRAGQRGAGGVPVHRAYLVKFVGPLGASNRTDMTATFTGLTGETYNTITKVRDGTVHDPGVPLGVDPSIAKPTGVSAADPAIRSGEVDVSYTFAGSLVEIVTVVNATGAVVKKQDATASPAAVTGLTDGTAYGFYVRGRTAAGRIGPSAAKVVATPTAA